MVTKRYETLMLARTEITNDELTTIENSFDKICTDLQGKLTTFDKWGKYQLAYPVKKNSYGMYFLARYELPVTTVAEAAKKINTFLTIKCHETVLRSVTIALDASAPIAYLKPEAIDSNRPSSIDTMLKEGKIENLLDSVSSDDFAQNAQEDTED